MMPLAYVIVAVAAAVAVLVVVELCNKREGFRMILWWQFVLVLMWSCLMHRCVHCTGGV